MFLELVRVGCRFLACCGGSVKCQTCLIFHRHSMTLDLDCDSTYLETGLS